MLEFSILVKMSHNIVGHNTDYVIYSGVAFQQLFCMTISLAEGHVSSISNNVVK